MNYSKLKQLIKDKNLTLDKASALIGKSRNWLKYAEENDSMTVKDLESILKVIDLKPIDFFRETYDQHILNDPGSFYGQDSALKDKLIVSLEDQATNAVGVRTTPLISVISLLLLIYI